jgi:DNA-binding response OmpR family regulator
MKKILIIEDELMLQKTMAEYLGSENFEIMTASDGEEGLKAVRTFSPDLIILDIILPKMDGFQVMEKLNNDPELKKIPVIALTNLESTEDIQRAFERGAKNYLVKADYKLEDVVKKIKEILKM